MVASLDYYKSIIYIRTRINTNTGLIMKKPNITDTPWLFNGISNVNDIDDDTIASIHSMRFKADAKAISAVPEMIDVLMDFVYKYEHGNGDSAHVDKSLSSTCIDAREALIKAGVEL